jgi:hypothetical protein
MRMDRRGVGHLTLLVALIVLGGGLATQSAGQTTQSPAQPTATGDPGGKALDADAKGSAPGASGTQAPARFSGKVGPGGTVIGQDAPAAPGAPTKLTKAIERLGPGSTSEKSLTNERLGPGGASESQAATKGSQPAKQDRLQPARKPDPNSESAPAANQPGAQGGFRVFVDPTTGEITRPNEAQLQRLDEEHQKNQKNRAAAASKGRAEGVERAAAVGGGMILDVPMSLFSEVTATIGADSKVTFEESQSNAKAKEETSQGHQSQQQSLKSKEEQRTGPAGDANLALSLPSDDVTVSIVDLDAAGEGVNDSTPVAPVFGNPGTTLGAQRQNVFRAAAEYWGAILKSRVPIQVDARMDSLTCSATSAVLGSAGPNTVHRDYVGAPLAATWYVQATANSRAGVDLDATRSDITAVFNSDVDNPDCLGAMSWWYGIGAPAPVGTIDFYSVVLHEIGHGIGFLSLVSLQTGAKLGGLDDAYERWLWDWSTGGWPGMTNAQRKASAINTGQVIFWGPRATAASRGLLSAGLNAGYPRVFTPTPVQQGSSISHFDAVLTPNELMEPAMTAPPGPYAYVTSGALEDIGWKLLGNGVFDYGSTGTWTWNPTDGWFQPTSADSTNLEGWNGNFVGVYGGTWL